ncbi:HigA family addiction module antitoxin [Gehongia tenuis]|uniref:HigA family addiction module antidote protein n=1 Tax=Gehongia tenuis TaxID=2763655 RepID=A0A926HQ21_9FIRM|nr:HigA family addiction module antitoxin [Gehongia tenuis]MBC8532264.1 HigA family addiction module antidote protein [Gehongia tenuis]
MSNMIEHGDMVAFHPGYYVKDLIEELGITPVAFAKRIGIPKKTIRKLTNGEISLSDEMARKLSAATGISVDLWLNLQRSFDEKAHSPESAAI